MIFFARLQSSSHYIIYCGDFSLCYLYIFSFSVVLLQVIPWPVDVLLKENEQVRKPSLNWPSMEIIFPCDPVNRCLKINLFKTIETGFE